MKNSTKCLAGILLVKDLRHANHGFFVERRRKKKILFQQACQTRPSTIKIYLPTRFFFFLMRISSHKGHNSDSPFNQATKMVDTLVDDSKYGTEMANILADEGKRGTDECWKPIASKYNASNVEISNMGHVRADGWVYSSQNGNVAFRNDDGEKTSRRLSFLVAEVFVDNPSQFEHLRFLNGNPEDPRAVNIQWVKHQNWVPPEEYRYVTQKKRKEMQGVPVGVAWVWQKKAYVAQIMKNGKRETVHFSPAKYLSKEAALKAAVEWRRNKEDEYGITQKKRKKALGKVKQQDPHGNDLPKNLYFTPRFRSCGEHYTVRFHHYEVAKHFFSMSMGDRRVL